ncbi:hypothetical protein FANTH_14768 [Fusarium anthophilum]|uniref:Amino acid permease/ SLC12A domain-containing protein n=1 Tax=Fusarium anthophilum TaxID=48485 RepID=A0A8H5DLD6_9HYPO|nr:hypothetical protein FANTH_14768 [Fusarium anthophilum]
MASADSSSVSANDQDSLSFTEKPTENLDTADESPQASESSSATESRQPSSKEPERNRHGQKIWYPNLVYKGLNFIPTEIVAAAVLISFWVEWITVFGLLMAFTNCLFVRVFGELEFGFALLKIALIFIVNIMAIVIIAGGGPEGETLGQILVRH